AAADTFRAAAGEQLAIWARVAGAQLISQDRGADPGAVAFDAVKASEARGVDVLIVDTAGRLHTKQPLMDELSKIARVIEKAGAGPRALALVASVRPDLVLLDLNIPGISGSDLLATLKASDDTAGIPVIVVTAEEVEGRRAAMRAGAEDYLTKPFSPRALVQTVVRVLEGSSPPGG